MKTFLQTTTILLLFLGAMQRLPAQLNRDPRVFTRQDSLRGTLNSERTWWDVQSYELDLSVDIADQSIRGSNTISFRVTGAGQGRIMQIDLQEPMEMEQVLDLANPSKPVPFTREGNVYHLDFGQRAFSDGATEKISIQFKGSPRKAVNPPWDGGWIFRSDERGRPWVSVACQGLGASVWYPCKDYQGDEPDAGASIRLDVPDSLVAVANGKQIAKPVKANGRAIYQWAVSNPINNYNIIPYIGNYVSFTENFSGKNGTLTCEYWVLDYNLQKARTHFGRDVKRMLSCFEDWLGPYPFYEDNYKLVEASHLGMEHQSAVAYGNKYQNGYMGMDISGSGWGRDWDYIIIHESGHEWFGNNITTEDIADMWVHEGFTTYTEVLFTECLHGKKAGTEYVRGLRKNIENQRTIIGSYGVNHEGSQDMYYKGANLVHQIRQLMRNDADFKELLRGLNKDFYHATVSSRQVEDYIIKKTGLNLSPVFDQYLRDTRIPVLEYRINGSITEYRWNNVVDGFDMPVLILAGGKEEWLKPGRDWKKYTGKSIASAGNISVHPGFYVYLKQITPQP